MSRYRKVDPRMWGDAKFRRLSHDAQRVWFYLLTGPETTSLPGLIVTGQAALAEAIGLEPKAFREAFGEALREGMVKADFAARVVWLPNAQRYNAPESPNVVRSWRCHWDSVPECDLKCQAFQTLKAFVEALGEGFAKAFREACGQPSPNQDQDQEQYQEQERESTPAAPAPSPARAKRKAGVPIPEDFAPDRKHVDFARVHNIDLQLEWQKFKSDAEAEDRRHVRWGAAFTKWLATSAGWQRDRQAGRQALAAHEQVKREPLPTFEQAAARKPRPPTMQRTLPAPVPSLGLVESFKRYQAAEAAKAEPPPPPRPPESDSDRDARIEAERQRQRQALDELVAQTVAEVAS